eukprot:5510045-Alexandrium_andersonii.AAC.1
MPQAIADGIIPLPALTGAFLLARLAQMSFEMSAARARATSAEERGGVLPNGPGNVQPPWRNWWAFGFGHRAPPEGRRCQ